MGIGEMIQDTYDKLHKLLIWLNENEYLESVWCYRNNFDSVDLCRANKSNYEIYEPVMRITKKYLFDDYIGIEQLKKDVNFYWNIK